MTPTPITPSFLERLPLFEGATPSQLETAARLIRFREVPAGETIIREGEPGDEMFLLVEGEINITKRLTLYNPNGGPSGARDKSLQHLKASEGVFFGEMSMFGPDERSATVTAHTAVLLGVITREQLLALSEQDPKLALCLYRNIGRRIAANLRRANRDILKLTTAFCLALEGR